MFIDDYTLIKPLGKGAFGEVYLSSKQGSKQKFAIKKIDKKLYTNPKAKKYLYNEIKILKEIDHINVIKLFDVKETQKYYFLITEYCNGGSLSDNLENYLEKFKHPFNEEIVQFLVKQIIIGVKYLHKKNIVHRDIKLDNILLNYDSEDDKRNKNLIKARVKITDFGFSRYLAQSERSFSPFEYFRMYPPLYKKKSYSQKIDIWMIGEICYELLS